MAMHTSRRHLEAKRQRLLRQLAQLGPWISGSLVSTARVCGKAGCACHHGGPKHPALFLTWKEQGKTVSFYVPRALEAEVKTWAATYKRVKALIRELSNVQKQLVHLREP